MKIQVPIRLVSQANISEHWSKKYSRYKKHAFFIVNALRPHTFRLPCVVTLTRVAPRKLDEDNLIGGAMKHVRDVVADFLIPGLAKGRADGDPRIQWKYGQEKGKPREYALIIEIVEG